MNIYRKIAVFLFSILGVFEAAEFANNIVTLTNKALITQMSNLLHISESMEITRLYILSFYTLVLAISALVVARGLVKKWNLAFPLAIFSVFLFMNYAVFNFMQARMFRPIAGQMDMVGTAVFILSAAAFGSYYISREVARKQNAIDSLSENK